MNDMSNKHEIKAYIKDNPVAILGTVDPRGNPHGAAVYICCCIRPDQLYFVTKTQTHKFKNIVENPKVSVTMVNPAENSSFQASGHASIVKEAEVIELVMGELAKIYAHSPDWLPPIAKLRAGPYQVVSIRLHKARLSTFLGMRAGSPNITKDL